jgi:ribonuclease HI
LEKLVDRHIRDGPLRRHPLHELQCAYQPGKSTETALHLVINRAEQAIENKELCLAAFLDVEGAFDRTTYNAISEAAARHGIEPTICKWIGNMLNDRLIKSSLLGDEITATATKGCPQGGVLSPTLWSLVVNSLLEELNNGPIHTVGYADDLVILVNGKFPGTVSEIMNEALRKVERWCNCNQLSINPSKTIVIPFTRKKTLPRIQQIKLYGRVLELSSEVKYLGVTLDKKLNWKKHTDLTITKALRVFGMCRSAYGKTWGLNPKVLRWIYTMMVRPILLYGSLAWWPRTLGSTCKNTLAKVQRTVCMAITGAFQTTPTAALEVLLDLTPLHMVIQSEARKSLHRLRILGLWSDGKPKTKHTNMETDSFLDRITNMGCDKMQPEYVFHRNFTTEIPTRAEWAEGLAPPNSGTENSIWYTDGSKMASGTGAGIYANDYNSSVSMGRLATVFQAETYAITACAQENIDRGTRDRAIYILSDSQAALKALTAPKVDSRLIYNGIQALNKLGRHNKVHLIWIPGHEGFIGNERADELARRGSTNCFVGPEPFVGLSQGTIKTALNAYTKTKHQNEWRNEVGLRHSKLFIERVDPGWTKKIWKLSRNQLRIITGVFTGHFGVRSQLAKMGLSDDLDCRMCGEEDETMKHLLCECHALARLRMKTFGTGHPEPKEFKALPLNSIIRFVEMVERAVE